VLNIGGVVPNPLIDWRGQITPGIGAIRGNPQLRAATQYISGNAGNLAGMQDPRQLYGSGNQPSEENDVLVALLRSLLGDSGMSKLPFSVPPPVIKEKPKEKKKKPGVVAPGTVGDVGNAETKYIELVGGQ
jgi:hypothetical protein